MIRVEIDTQAHYSLEQVDKNAPGAVELPTGGFVVRRKLSEPTVHHVAVRESGIDLMHKNMLDTPKNWSWEQCFLHNVSEAVTGPNTYSDREDWTALRCSDSRLERMLKTVYGMEDEG